MEHDSTMEPALAAAWHAEVAKNSMERWQRICRQNNWSRMPQNLPLLIRIFGASWYFTRFIFVNSQHAAGLLDETAVPAYDGEYFRQVFAPVLEINVTGTDEFEEAANRLRILKNTCMLRLLADYLKVNIDLERLEHALTELAEHTLAILLQLIKKMPQYPEFPVTILGMGRLAGYEMTFGSDLDLIFLHDPGDEDLHQQVGKTIRFLLRTISQPAAAGLLYEVDMRLRPHGNSGPLLTSRNTFAEYHREKRDIWEQQMMTRCRPVLISGMDVEPVLGEVFAAIYSQHDTELLRREIYTMRMRVQKELGSPAGRHEIKRGYGGIMDIDFISHYYQLAYGCEHDALRTGSTRAALRQAGRLGLLTEEKLGILLDGYDYLKKVEMCLRLFDLKAIDSFTTSGEDNLPLSRAMGHGDESQAFLQEYESVTHAVRACFRELLEPPG